MKYPEDFINKIICGNCLEILPLIPNNSIDLVLIDPPFIPVFGSTVHSSQYYDRSDLGAFTILEGWWETILKELKRVLKEKKLIYLLCDWRTYPSFWRVSLKLGLYPVNLIIWVHNSARRFGKYRYCHQLIYVFSKGKINREVPSGTSESFDVWHFNNVKTNERILVGEKPLELFKKIVQDATKENDLILDTYIGSGTTMRACLELKRNFIGIEINPEYCEIAEERLKNTPKKLDEIITNQNTIKKKLNNV